MPEKANNTHRKLTRTSAQTIPIIDPKNLCFATDNPEPPRWIELSQRLMDELELPPDLQERFWWRNGARWLGIEDDR